MLRTMVSRIIILEESTHGKFAFVRVLSLLESFEISAEFRICLNFPCLNLEMTEVFIDSNSK